MGDRRLQSAAAPPGGSCWPMDLKIPHPSVQADQALRLSATALTPDQDEHLHHHLALPPFRARRPPPTPSSLQDDDTTRLRSLSLPVRPSALYIPPSQMAIHVPHLPTGPSSRSSSPIAPVVWFALIEGQPLSCSAPRNRLRVRVASAALPERHRCTIQETCLHWQRPSSRLVALPSRGTRHPVNRLPPPTSYSLPALQG